MYSESGVFSHVGRLSPMGFDKMSETVRVREIRMHPAGGLNERGKKGESSES